MRKDLLRSPWFPFKEFRKTLGPPKFVFNTKG